MYQVKFKGKTGFIKPFYANRASDINSEVFVTPSMLKGIQKSIGVNNIIAAKVYAEHKFIEQQVVKHKYDNIKGKKGKKTSILNRNTLLNPIIYLLFDNLEDANMAMSHSFCLCRNEDIVFPTEQCEITLENFYKQKGFHFIETGDTTDLFIGFNNLGEKQYGKLMNHNDYIS